MGSKSHSRRDGHVASASCKNEFVMIKSGDFVLVCKIHDEKRCPEMVLWLNGRYVED